MGYSDLKWEMGDDIITINGIEPILSDSKRLPVDSLYHMCIHKDKDDHDTRHRVRLANLEYPILVSTLKGKVQMILDGHHRLLKAKHQRIQYIDARVLVLDELPQTHKAMFSTLMTLPGLEKSQ
jgi:hypothetical protein